MLDKKLQLLNNPDYTNRLLGYTLLTSEEKESFVKKYSVLLSLLDTTMEDLLCETRIAITRSIDHLPSIPYWINRIQLLRIKPNAIIQGFSDNVQQLGVDVHSDYRLILPTNVKYVSFDVQCHSNYFPRIDIVPSSLMYVDTCNTPFGNKNYQHFLKLLPEGVIPLEL